MQAIVFTSPLQGDGKTTTCTNCALTLARRGYKVLLVDADLRRGTINRQFSVARSPGLSDVLAGITPLADATRTVYLGDDATVNYITTGTRSANPSGLIDSVATRTLVAEVREQFDFVLFDTPPVNVVTDAAILSAECDGVILVARAGVTDEGALRLAMDRLESVRAAVLGVLLNDIDLKRERTFDNAYQYLQDGYYAPTAD
jgi:capsular exopolysaccharide synthesis family protein